jgi:hypothetical protein
MGSAMGASFPDPNSVKLDVADHSISSTDHRPADHLNIGEDAGLVGFVLAGGGHLD